MTLTVRVSFDSTQAYSMCTYSGYPSVSCSAGRLVRGSGKGALLLPSHCRERGMVGLLGKGRREASVSREDVAI